MRSGRTIINTPKQRKLIENPFMRVLRGTIGAAGGA
jgi:hypothetical protein